MVAVKLRFHQTTIRREREMKKTKYCIYQIVPNGDTLEEITVHEFYNLKDCYKKFLTLDDSKTDWRFCKQYIAKEYIDAGNIEHHWEQDFDFEGNDDCYVSTYVENWQEFVKQKLKGETNDLNKS